MAMFKTDSNRVFFEVLESAAGPQFTLETGQVLEVAGAVPREVQDFERVGLVRRLPDPGALLPWLRVVAKIRPVSEATFAPARPEPAAPTFTEKGVILQRFGWTPEQLKAAQTRLGFPATRAKTRFNFETGEYQVVAESFDDLAVAKWQRELPTDLIAHAGR